MSDENEKPQLPSAGTSILTNTKEQNQSTSQQDEESAEEIVTLQTQEDQDTIATQDLLDNNPNRVQVPDISITRPSVSLHGPEDTLIEEERREVEEVQKSEQPEAINGRDEKEESVSNIDPSLLPKTETAIESNGEQLPPSPPAKTEARPDSEKSLPTQDSSGQSRRSSVTSTTSTTVHSRSSLSSLNKGSAVFVISALEQIESSKEAKGSKAGPKALKEASQRALEMIKNASGSSQQTNSEAELDPRIVFEPLRLACLTGSTNLIITSLDCLGKLVSYSFFAEDTPNIPTENGEEALSDLVTTTVCDTFHDGLDERAQLQIIKALLAVVLSTSVHVHQSSLLKAVRTVYNIFLGSKSTPTQGVAQGVLTQMVHHVFGRVPRGPLPIKGSNNLQREGSKIGHLSPAGSRKTNRTIRSREKEGHGESNGEKVDEEVPLEELEKADDHRNGDLEETLKVQEGAAIGDEIEKEAEPVERVTLQTLESRASFEGASERDTTASLMQQNSMSQQELFVKDAFLVLRALCKLSMKPLGPERCVFKCVEERKKQC